VYTEIVDLCIVFSALFEKRRPSEFEREKERMGFKEHKRTIQEDIDGIKRKVIL